MQIIMQKRSQHLCVWLWKADTITVVGAYSNPSRLGVVPVFCGFSRDSLMRSVLCGPIAAHDIRGEGRRGTVVEVGGCWRLWLFVWVVMSYIYDGLNMPKANAYNGCSETHVDRRWKLCITTPSTAVLWTTANAETESPEIVCWSPLCRSVIICGSSSKDCAIEWLICTRERRFS